MSKYPWEVSRRDFLQTAAAAAIAAGIPPAAGAMARGAEQPSQSASATRSYDLGRLKWQLSGFPPYLWEIDHRTDIHDAPQAEVGPVEAPVPGSVQMALLRAGVIQDWNVALNARAAEWVENRDWIYQTQIPDAWLTQGKQIWLRCAGLDYKGHILLNGVPILEFKGSFVPYEVDLKPHLKPSANTLQIWFQPPPRWMGEFGYTFRIKEWKPRFNYYWDWTSRLVQIGIWDAITLDVVPEAEILTTQCLTGAVPDSGDGTLRFTASASGGSALHVAAMDGHRILREQTLPLRNGAADVAWDGLPVRLWWPNGMGSQPLYTVRVHLLDDRQQVLDSRDLRVGFRHIEWKRTQGAPADAYPFLCAVNGKEVFLCGVNWTPIRPNFADLSEEDYNKRVDGYQQIGMNVLRVWGGAYLERPWFYDRCDEKGLLVWQEFPLSSSGLDNCPPDDDESIEQMSAIAASYIHRIQHHASLLLWCGGNELEDNRADHASSEPTLTVARLPMMVKLGEIVAAHDPARFYMPTAPYSPFGTFTPETVGKGVHWDVHGPYMVDGPVDGAWAELWHRDDAMFHSEMGSPSTSPVEIIRRYKGDLPDFPATHSNPLWNRQPWWIDWPKFVQETGREPHTLEEFVDWSQKRQSDSLALALSAAKSRFPACGGLIIWMGHDSFPCTANTAIIDFEGNPKPAAVAIGRILLPS